MVENEEIQMVRAFNPLVMDMIVDHLIPDVSFDRQDLCDMIKLKMIEDGDNTFVMVVWRGEDEIVGFTIAWIPNGRKHAWLEEAWLKSTLEDRSIALKEFDCLLTWCESKGLKEIRCETKRSPRAMLRKFGFHEFSHILTRSINHG